MARHATGAGFAVEPARPAPVGLVTLAPWALVPGAILALLAVLLLSAGHGAPSVRVPAPRLRSESLLSAPAALRRAVDSTLAGKDPAYAVRSAGGALSAVGPATQLRSSFTTSGASISAGRATLGLDLSGIGFGSRLQPVTGGVPRAHGNRVLYAAPGLTQWYVNGPEGVEQGFTLDGRRVARGAVDR